LILGQAVANVLVLPLQLSQLRSALDLNLERFAKAIGTQAAIMVVGGVFLSIIAGYIQFDSVLRLTLGSGLFCIIVWILQYFLVLEKRHRTIFPAMGQLMGLVPKSN
jgi:hypothetical protein